MKEHLDTASSSLTAEPDGSWRALLSDRQGRQFRVRIWSVVPGRDGVRITTDAYDGHMDMPYDQTRREGFNARRYAETEVIRLQLLLDAGRHLWD